jgi:broad specificity phosphatase PhoE
VLPEAVSTFVRDGAQGGTDEYLTVNHGSVIGLLIEAIKELRAEVDALRAKL